MLVWKRHHGGRNRIVVIVIVVSGNEGRGHRQACCERLCNNHWGVVFVDWKKMFRDDVPFEIYNLKNTSNNSGMWKYWPNL